VRIKVIKISEVDNHQNLSTGFMSKLSQLMVIHRVIHNIHKNLRYIHPVKD